VIPFDGEVSMTAPVPPSATGPGMEPVLRCGAARPNPPFVPAIYDHKAWLIHETPSAVSRDADLLARAILEEHAVIRPDALTVGIDVYNIEAEAAGCKVTFYDDGSGSIPGIETGHHAFRIGDDFPAMPVPDPRKDGRMWVNVEAARRVVRELGPDCWVRGAISGPFSLAANLVGAEELFLACLEEPERAHSLLGYAVRIIREYAKAHVDAGAGLVMFDSQASPDMISRKMYEEFVLPPTKDLIRHFAAQGVRDVPLIVGGNVAAIIDLLIETGANNLLCDFTADWDECSRACRAAKRALRRNISSRLIQESSPDEIYAAARREIERAGDFPGFLMGTAVICFGTATEKILAVRQACNDVPPRL